MKYLKDSIYYSTLVRKNIEDVWEAFIDVNKLRSWFSPSVEISFETNSIKLVWVDWGKYRIYTEDRGSILNVEKPHCFSFSCHPYDPNHEIIVKITLEEVSEGTLIRLHEYGYQNIEGISRAMVSRAAGWGEVLTMLKVYLEHGIKC